MGQPRIYVAVVPAWGPISIVAPDVAAGAVAGVPDMHISYFADPLAARYRSFGVADRFVATENVVATDR